MKDYTDAAPVFSDKIQIPETSDKAHADIINTPSKQLLANTLVLKKQAGSAETYSQDKTYSVGDFVTNDGITYKCTADIGEAEPWDPEHWEEVNIIAEVGAIQEEAKKSNIQIYSKINHLDPGKNLADVFDGEISRYSDEYEWIMDRIDKTFFDGLCVEDYLPLTVSGEEHEMQIAGINSYVNTGWTETHGVYDTTKLNPVPPHIDFISRDCLKQTYQWNTTATNSGTGDGHDDGTDVPWLTSNIKSELDKIYETLPEKAKKHIVNKIMLLERRAKKDPVLTASTGWHWYPMGNLWLPTEYEVFGSVIWGTPGYSAGQALQYPIFANNWKNRTKGAGPKGERCTWWLAVVTGFAATHACYVAAYGHAANWTATDSIRVPVCFRYARRAQS